MDVVACDNGNENDFTKLSTSDYIKHLDSLLVSSKPASEYDQIYIVIGVKLKIQKLVYEC